MSEIKATHLSVFLEAKKRHEELLVYIDRMKREEHEIRTSGSIRYWTTTYTSDPDMPSEMHHLHENEFLNGVAKDLIDEWASKNFDFIVAEAISRSESNIAYWAGEARKEYRTLFGKDAEA